MSDLSELAAAVRAAEEGRAPYLSRRTPHYSYELWVQNEEGDGIELNYRIRARPPTEGLAVIEGWRSGTLTYNPMNQCHLNGNEKDASIILQTAITDAHHDVRSGPLHEIVKTYLEAAHAQLTNSKVLNKP